MERPKFYVDFNEALDANLVLFSKEDTKVDAKGNLIALHEGLEIAVFMDDYNSETKASDFLVATGVVESNSSGGWGAEVKWCGCGSHPEQNVAANSPGDDVRARKTRVRACRPNQALAAKDPRPDAVPSP